MCNRVATTEWKYATNTSDFNRRRMKEQQSVAAKFECLSWKRAATFDTSQMSDLAVKRQLERIFRQGKCGLGDEKYSEYTHIIGIMKDTYNNAKVCAYRDGSLLVLPSFRGIDAKTSNFASIPTNYCDLKIDPDITRIMEVSRNEAELRYYWEAWREKIGPPLKNSFMRYLDLANQAARNHGFRDAGEQMRAIYEDKDFFFVVQDLWARVLPLYKHLFTFVRKGLVRKYGIEVIRPDGPIPAHLLGNMWGQNWRHILEIVKPGSTETPDVTGEMVRRGFTPLKIFQTSEEFFTSLGLPPMSPEFWRNSMLQKSKDVHTQCTASAWDFCNNIDFRCAKIYFWFVHGLKECIFCYFRIKQCTQITVEDFVNSHHEMTHIQYYMQYSGQPFVYREGPNPAFQEAVAHAIGLCVGGPVHLQRIGLLTTPIATSNGNSMINIEYLLGLALDKLPFMAFSLAVEKWRWYIFEKGPIGLNSKWWDLRLRYQGLVPPIQRYAEHFDAGSKYHIISDQEYIKYFVGTVLQFQIFSELCQAAGHVGPLHTCDFYRSRESGRILRYLNFIKIYIVKLIK